MDRAGCNSGSVKHTLADKVVLETLEYYQKIIPIAKRKAATGTWHGWSVTIQNVAENFKSGTEIHRTAISLIFTDAVRKMITSKNVIEYQLSISFQYSIILNESEND